MGTLLERIKGYFSNLGKRLLQFIAGLTGIVIFLHMLGQHNDAEFIYIDGTELVTAWGMFLSSSVILIFIYIWFLRCNKCKKWFAMRKRYSRHVESETGTRQEETGQTVSERTGKITERHYTNVEYTRDIYSVTYSCKHCGNEKFRRKKGKFRKT
jgi:uncharacterized C2H2 Zn-finger protein